MQAGRRRGAGHLPLHRLRRARCQRRPRDQPGGARAPDAAARASAARLVAKLARLAGVVALAAPPAMIAAGAVPRWHDPARRSGWRCTAPASSVPCSPASSRCGRRRRSSSASAERSQRHRCDAGAAAVQRTGAVSRGAAPDRTRARAMASARRRRAPRRCRSAAAVPSERAGPVRRRPAPCPQRQARCSRRRRSCDRCTTPHRSRAAPVACSRSNGPRSRRVPRRRCPAHRIDADTGIPAPPAFASERPQAQDLAAAELRRARQAAERCAADPAGRATHPGLAVPPMPDNDMAIALLAPEPPGLTHSDGSPDGTCGAGEHRTDAVSHRRDPAGPATATGRSDAPAARRRPRSPHRHRRSPDAPAARQDPARPATAAGRPPPFAATDRHRRPDRRRRSPRPPVATPPPVAAPRTHRRDATIGLRTTAPAWREPVAATTAARLAAARTSVRAAVPMPARPGRPSVAPTRPPPLAMTSPLRANAASADDLVAGGAAAGHPSDPGDPGDPARSRRSRDPRDPGDPRDPQPPDDHDPRRDRSRGAPGRSTPSRPGHGARALRSRSATTPHRPTWRSAWPTRSRPRCDDAGAPKGPVPDTSPTGRAASAASASMTARRRRSPETEPRGGRPRHERPHHRPAGPPRDPRADTGRLRDRPMPKLADLDRARLAAAAEGQQAAGERPVAGVPAVRVADGAGSRSTCGSTARAAGCTSEASPGHRPSDRPPQASGHGLGDRGRVAPRGHAVPDPPRPGVVRRGRLRSAVAARHRAGARGRRVGSPGRGSTRVYAGPLRRQQQTAQYASEGAGGTLPALQHARRARRVPGVRDAAAPRAAADRRGPEVRAADRARRRRACSTRRSRPSSARWSRDEWAVDGVERVAAFVERVRAGLDRVLRAAGSGARLACVTSAGPIGVAVGLVFGHPAPSAWCAPAS